MLVYVYAEDIVCLLKKKRQMDLIYLLQWSVSICKRQSDPTSVPCENVNITVVP